MKRRVVKFAAWALGLAALGLALVAAGLLPIAASAGHWTITAWFLHFAMERSVATHSLGVEPPPLDVERRVLLGAGHYETGCRPCHGAPGERMPVIPRAMTPHPPDLTAAADEWSPAELFTLVLHGVKMTGMPAWPALAREDEVWAVVAFLERLPDMNAAEYDALVRGDEAERAAAAGAPSVAVQACARCHGAGGLGRGAGAFPKLAGQREAYLLAALRAYASGERASGVMQPLAAALSEAEMRELAAHYASLPPPEGEPADGELRARGEALALDGAPRERVPSCADCHGPAPPETAPPEPRANYPRLAGQHASYLEQQLELFSEGHRGGSPFAAIMHTAASELTPEQRAALAAFYSSLAPER